MFKNGKPRSLLNFTIRKRKSEVCFTLTQTSSCAEWLGFMGRPPLFTVFLAAMPGPHW